MTLSDNQTTTSAAVSTSAKAASPDTSITSSSSGSSAALAFVTPLQEDLRTRLAAKVGEKGFFKTIQNTLAGGLGSLASDFNAAIPTVPSVSSSDTTVKASSDPNQPIDTAAELLSLAAHQSTSSVVQITDPSIISPCSLCARTQ